MRRIQYRSGHVARASSTRLPFRTDDAVSMVALYYYSASHAIYAETPKRTTMYVSRPNDGIDKAGKRGNSASRST